MQVLLNQPGASSLENFFASSASRPICGGPSSTLKHGPSSAAPPSSVCCKLNSYSKSLGASEPLGTRRTYRQPQGRTRMEKSCTVATSGGTSNLLIGRLETPKIVLMTPILLISSAPSSRGNRTCGCAMSFHKGKSGRSASGRPTRLPRVSQSGVEKTNRTHGWFWHTVPKQ